MATHEFKIDLSEFEVQLLRSGMELVADYYDDEYFKNTASSVVKKIDTYIKPHIKNGEVTAYFFKSEVKNLISSILAFMMMYFNVDTYGFYDRLEELEEKQELLIKINSLLNMQIESEKEKSELYSGINEDE